MQDGWRPTPHGVVLRDPALSWITVIIQYGYHGRYHTPPARLLSHLTHPTHFITTATLSPAKGLSPCARRAPPPQERHWTAQCRCSVAAHAYGTDSHTYFQTGRRHRSLLASMLRRTSSARSAQEEHGGAASRRRRRGSAGGSTRGVSRRRRLGDNLFFFWMRIHVCMCVYLLYIIYTNICMSI